jgi:hypothetical protein
MDYDAAEAMKELLEQGSKEAKKDLVDWEVKEFEGKNILFYKGKNYVPMDVELQRKIVQRYHNHPMLQTILFFLSSSSTCACLMPFILLIWTWVYLQEYMSHQTHVQHVFASQ